MHNLVPVPARRLSPGASCGLTAEHLLGLVTELLPVVVWIADRQLRFACVLGNIETVEALGMAGVEGTSLLDYFETDDPEFPPLAAHQAALRGSPQSYQWQAGDRLLEVSLSPVALEAGVVAGVLGLALDVTERERARLASEQRYRQLFEEAPDVIFTVDLRGNFTSVNKAAERVSGYRRQELLGMHISDLLEPDTAAFVAERIQRALGGETSAEFELPIRAKSGQQVLLEVNARLQFSGGRPVGIQGIARDITERKHLEEQLRQRQKLEAIAELAGGIAHDFNNLLTAVLGYTDLLKSYSSPGQLAYEAAEVIQKAGERAQQLASRLLGFARRGKAQNIPVDIHELLGELGELLEHALPKNIRVEMPVSRTPLVVIGDPGQLHQVFLNLALNARDAMPEGGLLSFCTELVTLDAEGFRQIGTASPGPHIRVSVSDTGTGIPAELLPRLFDPFFTTKDRRDGKGLGLAMVYGIVKNHGGAVRVTSQPGVGSTFEVYLPLAPADAKPAEPQAEQPAPGTGVILVVDDEPVVGQTAARLLEKLGYQAIAISDPVQAVEVVRADPHAFDLVILDLLMPGLSGQKCFEMLRAVRRDVPVLVTSGYAEELVAQRLIEAGARGFLPKPFHLRTLAEAVRQAMRG